MTTTFVRRKSLKWILILMTGLLLLTSYCKSPEKDTRVFTNQVKDIFDVRNGILHQNGKPVFALGTNYYASYHPKKFPVLPENDRISEMRKDIKGMRDAGFNIIRIAALGDIKRSEDETVKVNFPLTDTTVAYAYDNGIASIVRLQGYITNLSGYPDADVKLWNEKNEVIGPYDQFLTTCLNHEGIRRDEEDACVASAAHFRAYPGVVAHKIYNEPSYSRTRFQCYNPHSIEAWRKWLVARGLKSASEAELLQPPRRRPYYDEDANDWINWRMFHHERMSWYLNNLSDKAKEGNPSASTMTNFTGGPLLFPPGLEGIDYFRIAERMDIVGITNYVPNLGENSFQASAIYDMAESAAAIFGKHAWNIEANAKTNLSGEEWERQTISMIGSGFKGILYYQWRADYPFSNSPEPEMYGMLWNDGRRTEKFDKAVAMNHFVNEYGTLFAMAEKKRSGVGILYPDYARFWHDARDSRSSGPDLNIIQTLFAYKELRRAGVAVEFVRPQDLSGNLLNIKLLVIPVREEALSAEEKSLIDAFLDSGGKVCYPSYLSSKSSGGAGGFYIIKGLTFLTDHHSRWDSYALDAGSVLEKVEIKPLYQVDYRHLDVKILEGNDDSGHYQILCLNNIDPLEKPVPVGRILRIENITGLVNAVFLFPGRKEKLRCLKRKDSLEISLPEITTGGFIVLR
jgi:hypothetical protein